MSRRTAVCVSLLAGLLSGYSNVSAQESVTLDEAVRRSLGAHPSVESAAARVAIAEAGIEEAEAARWPRISATGSVFQYEEPMVVTPIHGFGDGQFPEFDDTLIQSALNVDLLLWDGGGTPSLIDQRESQAIAARYGATAASDALMLRTSAVYLSALARQALLVSHDARIEALGAELDRVTRLVEVGRAADVDLLRVEAALASAAAERKGVATELDATLRELARLTDAPEPFTVADVDAIGLSYDQRGALEARALESNPTVLRARELVVARKAEQAAVRSIYMPQVRALGSWLQYGDDSLSVDSEWNVGIRIRVPVWDGGATSARVAQASAAVRAAEEEARLEEHRVLDRLDATIAAIDRAAANVESLRTAVARYEEIVRVEKLRLETGVGTETDYLRAEADLLQARSGLAAAQYQQILERISLAQVVGELDPEWISTNLRSRS